MTDQERLVVAYEEIQHLKGMMGQMSFMLYELLKYSQLSAFTVSEPVNVAVLLRFEKIPQATGEELWRISRVASSSTKGVTSDDDQV